MPLVCVLGSNVYFFRLGVHYCFFWWLLIILLHRQISADERNLLPAVSVIISLLLTANILNYHIPRIYDMHSGQDLVPYQYAEGSTIKVKAPMAEYFTDLHAKLSKYKNNVNQGYVIGMYQMPAEIALTGMRIYYNPLIWGPESLYLIRHAKTDPRYNSIFPMVVSKDKKGTIQDLSGLFRVELLDSVRHPGSGNTYIFQTDTF